MMSNRNELSGYERSLAEEIQRDSPLSVVANSDSQDSFCEPYEGMEIDGNDVSSGDDFENIQPAVNNAQHVSNLTARIHTTYRDIIILQDELDHWDKSLADMLNKLPWSEVREADLFADVVHEIQLGTTITWFTARYVSYVSAFTGGVDFLNLWKNNDLLRVECTPSESVRFNQLLNHVFPGDMLLFFRTDWAVFASFPFTSGPIFTRDSNVLVLSGHSDPGMLF